MVNVSVYGAKDVLINTLLPLPAPDPFSVRNACLDMFRSARSAALESAGRGF